MSLGTPQTLFILDEMDKDNMVGVPMSGGQMVIQRK